MTSGSVVLGPLAMPSQPVNRSLAFLPCRLATGRSAIREVYTGLLAGRPRLTGEIRPAIRNGDIAITSTVRAGNATVEVARARATAPGCG